MKIPPNLKRCGWCSADPLYIAYHDKEWGRPVHDDRLLFEFIVLEGAQAGLSWLTILKKRAHYRQVFDYFDASQMTRYDARKVASLLADPGIVRNRLKIGAAIINAGAFLAVQKEWGSFNAYIWQFAPAKPIQKRRANARPLPTQTQESIAMSKDLKARGFKCVGPTMCYAFMQAVGMVDDHSADCFRSQEEG